MGKTFYIESVPYTCARHQGKPAGYVVKSQGEVYRHACTMTCAKAQAAELTRAWSNREGD